MEEVKISIKIKFSISTKKENEMNFDTEKKTGLQSKKIPVCNWSSILIEELPVLVPAEEGGPHFRHLLFRDHRQSSLQSVAHLDLRALSVKLNSSGTENQKTFSEKSKI